MKGSDISISELGTSEFPNSLKTLEHQHITMRDGCRLSARIWLPENAEHHPVPAILEHLPYRKRDGTVARDSLNHPWFAAHGYACLRVDMRGNGDSEGLMCDEYTQQEWTDACDVIAWAIKQPWCTGKVGMMGISWGGFNALQVAALQPEGLKAIITCCSSVDRFADDIHFKGGCLLGENIGWAANMLSYSSRPPDPMLVGDSWRSLWLDRLENMPFLATEWISRQRRDDYWTHGSVCEEYSSVSAAVLSIGGWHDGYRNTVSHLVENVQCSVQGIVGPWIHKYPHYAAPAPRIGFLQVALRWWDHWLKGIDNGVEADPVYRAYLMDSIAPAPWYDHRPGRWIAEQQWPSPSIVQQRYICCKNNRLVTSRAENKRLLDVNINSPAHCGSTTGEYFPFTFGPELPDDQQNDDALSVCFDSELLTTSMDIVGAPLLDISCHANKALALLAVRLCDVHPDGSSTLMTLGLLNLTHANSSEHPQLLEPDMTINTQISLDQLAYRVPAGHRLRIAVSTNYWPFVWPSPHSATVSLKQLSLGLPIRNSERKDDECTFDPPESAPAWPHEIIREPVSTRRLLVDPDSGNWNTYIRNDFGENRDSDHQLVSGSDMQEHWSIHPDDPLSASVNIEWTQIIARDQWRIETKATVHMHGDEHWFYITGSLDAWENGKRVFQRVYDEKVARKFV